MRKFLQHFVRIVLSSLEQQNGNGSDGDEIMLSEAHQIAIYAIVASLRGVI